MSFATLFSFHGRVGRAAMWMLLVGTLVLEVLLFIVFYAMSSTDPTTGQFAFGPFAPIIGLVFGLIVFIVSLGLNVRRCHDHNRSGWFILLYFVPIANMWMLVETYFVRGTVGSNEFGYDPIPSQRLATNAEVFQ